MRAQPQAKVIFYAMIPRKLLVIIESPFSGDVEKNVAYARACVRDSVLRGEAPIASHLLFTQPGILDDNVPAERTLGINAGHAWLIVSDFMAVYCGLGISPGMRLGIERAEEAGLGIVFRDENGAIAASLKGQ